MTLRATYFKYNLNFHKPAGTSRGMMLEKETWFIVLEYEGKKGLGECGLLRGLSIDDRLDYESKLNWVCDNISLGLHKLLAETIDFPSIQFGLETAFASLEADDMTTLFPSDFTAGNAPIPINGLVWMGEKTAMKSQIIAKLNEGFRCIKLKIGAIDFEQELALLAYIRSQFDANTIEIRLDANGAFSPEQAITYLHRLASYGIHSIEQPIAAKQWESMAALCAETPIPIALDEELIGVFAMSEKKKLLQTIKPQYVILKPSLVGGFSGMQSWITEAESLQIPWWVTSALESNVGLNAIAQWTFLQQNPLPQGLGTGGLYTNNVLAPLEVRDGHLHYHPNLSWNFTCLGL
jgi:o-succinylbenzoate synthase